MQAGLLNEIILIERNHLHRNSYGEEQSAWELHIKTRARIDFRGANNVIENDERVFTRSLTFIVRIYHDIRNDDRIIYNSQKYRIMSIEKRKNEMRQIITAELINE